ncbi:uncharacterized protein BCR38DRAFT_167797 [Pseudomassariella vexata]|uniref:Uncharacterized protein n=1 Tax=Pseudomassariella vexata TaxID=1141098 RepID=A0A1Y2E2V8_9PEZI|nr:uncharacterized protein BCR38DRAFT_167797 [Pseudomassariella vexata]ORY65862.1 hypothetical protein BCR38DRAFT_167797 [Pseudomassariella vexata]
MSLTGCNRAIKGCWELDVSLLFKLLVGRLAVIRGSVRQGPRKVPCPVLDSGRIQLQYLTRATGQRWRIQCVFMVGWSHGRETMRLERPNRGVPFRARAFDRHHKQKASQIR